VDSTEPQYHLERICHVFSAKTKEFPVGIKMRLVAEISHLSSKTDGQKAERRQALQARFLAISGTQRLHVITSPKHDKHYLRAFLRKFLLHNPLPTPPEDHLFYAVSPVPASDEIIVRFLPQHQLKVDKVLSQLVRHLPGINIGRAIPPRPMPPTDSTPVVRSLPRTLPGKPVTTLDPQVAGYQEALDKYFPLKFPTVFKLFSTPVSKQSFIHSDPIISNLTILPCKHVLYRWLQALGQLFQNTAWDKWQYQIGILWEWRDPVTLAPCSNQSAN